MNMNQKTSKHSPSTKTMNFVLTLGFLLCFYSCEKNTNDEKCNNITETYSNILGKVFPLGLRIIDRTTGNPIYIFCRGEAHPVQSEHIDGDAFLDDWDWDVDYGYITYDNPYGNNSMATLRPITYSFGVEIRAHNACGWSEWADMDPYTIFCGFIMFTMHPNPTDDFVEITAYEDTDKTGNWSIPLNMWSGFKFASFNKISYSFIFQLIPNLFYK